ncbi:IS3 family transposase [Pedobacter sp. CG_S7]|uniref:IS3 family transposase n=1 Tax=Pedobacter sp. CG_S7 TaxID=3143930 RepID=UPI00339707E4
MGRFLKSWRFLYLLLIYPKTLKCELIYHRKFANREDAKIEIFRYIEGFYHAKRIHTALGDRTPNEMEIFYKTTNLLVA